MEEGDAFRGRNQDRSVRSVPVLRTIRLEEEEFDDDDDGDGEDDDEEEETCPG